MLLPLLFPTSCTRMKPDWDLLAEHFQDEPSVFIADVNCQVEEALCNGYHTGGTYPTVLVFPPPPPTRRNDSGETTNARRRPPAQLYQGGRGLEDLRKFADQSLVQPCRVDDVETTCSARAQKYIAKWTTKPRKEQTTEMARLKSITNTESSLTYDLSKWLTDRIAILEQLVAEKGQGNEL